MKVKKYACNHGNRKNLNEILHEVTKETLMEQNDRCDLRKLTLVTCVTGDN